MLSLPPPDPVAAARLLPWSPPGWSRSCGSCCCRTPNAFAGYGTGGTRPGRTGGGGKGPTLTPGLLAGHGAAPDRPSGPGRPARPLRLARLGGRPSGEAPAPSRGASHSTPPVEPQLALCGPPSTFLPGPSHACFLVPDPPVRGRADPQTPEHPLATAGGGASGEVGGARGGAEAAPGRAKCPHLPSAHTCHLCSSLKSLVLTSLQRETE